MNNFHVKEEWARSSFFNWGAESPSTPVAMEGLNGTAPPPFLNKTYDLVDDSSTNIIVSWGKGNNSFVVWDPQLFSLNLLPRYFKHSNFSSFVRQLNTYGFRKVDPDKWEFANEGFLRGKRHLLKKIKRKKTTSSQSQFEEQDVVDPCIELGRYGEDAEIDMLRRDKQVLMEELVKLKQEQKNSKAYLKAMEERVKGTEKKQQQVTSFLVRAMQNPTLVHKLIQEKDRKELEEAISNKRRRPIEYGDFGNNKFGELSSLGGGNDFVNNGIGNYGKITDVEDSELDRLAIDMQGNGEALKTSDEGYLQKEEKGGDGGLDQRFWDDLMNDGNEQKLGSFGFDKEDEEFRLCGFWSGIQLGLLSNDHLPARKELLVLQLEKEVDDEKAFGVAFDAFLIQGSWS